MNPLDTARPCSSHRIVFLAVVIMAALMAIDAFGAMVYKSYVVRYDRGWDILCDPYQVQQGDWVLKIFRQKGEIAHLDFREFLGIFQRLNPHVKDIDRIRPGQVVDIPLKKLAQGNLPGQSSGVVTIPFVMITTPDEVIKKHTRVYTIQHGDTVSQLIARQFGGRFGNLTYNQGLKLFQAANPHIQDVNRIYAGQKIYMPDPAIREQGWYGDLFDKEGNLVETMDDRADAQPETDAGPGASPPPPAVPAEAAEPTPEEPAGPAAEAAAAIGGRLMSKGTYYLPMKQGKDFELDLSHFPLIDMQNGQKVILTTADRVMNVDLPLIQAYWEDVKIAKIPPNASAQEIIQAVLSVVGDGEARNQLAFDDSGVTVSISAKWIRSEPASDGRVRHTCITPIDTVSQRTHAAILRYLDQNDIVIKEILTGVPAAAPAPSTELPPPATVERIDGASQKTLIESFCRRMGFPYAPDTSISFPYAGIQVQALSNLISFGNGREILIDFGDLYGDAIKAIRDTGLEVLQIQVDESPLLIIERLMETAVMGFTKAPVFYGADRPATYNTALTIDGLMVPSGGGENLLFVQAALPDLIERFIRDQGIQVVVISDSGAN